MTEKDAAYEIDPTLKALMLYAKKADELTVEGVTKVLRPIYSDDIRILDVVRIIIYAWQKALSEPRFAMRRRDDAVIDLLMAPVKGFHAVELWGPKNLETTYSVEQYYTSVIKAVLSDLRFTRVDWLNLNGEKA